jgi:hypothetical protein
VKVGTGSPLQLLSPVEFEVVDRFEHVMEVSLQDRIWNGDRTSWRLCLSDALMRTPAGTNNAEVHVKAQKTSHCCLIKLARWLKIDLHFVS